MKYSSCIIYFYVLCCVEVARMSLTDTESQFHSSDNAFLPTYSSLFGTSQFIVECVNVNSLWCYVQIFVISFSMCFQDKHIFKAFTFYYWDNHILTLNMTKYTGWKCWTPSSRIVERPDSVLPFYKYLQWESFSSRVFTWSYTDFITSIYIAALKNSKDNFAFISWPRIIWF